MLLWSTHEKYWDCSLQCGWKGLWEVIRWWQWGPYHRISALLRKFTFSTLHWVRTEKMDIRKPWREFHQKWGTLTHNLWLSRPYLHCEKWFWCVSQQMYDTGRNSLDSMSVFGISVIFFCVADCIFAKMVAMIACLPHVLLSQFDVGMPLINEEICSVWKQRYSRRCSWNYAAERMAEVVLCDL